MKKLTILLAFVIPTLSFAQPNNLHWKLGGNLGTGIDQVNATNNILGTNINVPLRIATNGTERMIVNGQRTTQIGLVGASIGNFTVNTTGFVGIGPNTTHPLYHPNGVWTDIGPFTLLHLHGVVNSNDFATDWGYRPWMRTGVSFTDQSDFSYVGNRSVDPATNLNEFTISWSNDGGAFPTPTPPHGGPDDMVFRFTSAYEGPDVLDPGPPSGNKGSNDFTRAGDIDGRHVARFTPDGFFALGPNFGHTFDNPLHVRPQSMFHMSSYQQEEAWFQITNQTGTGQTSTDGLRIGVTTNGIAHIKQQENLPLIFYTNNLSTARIVPEQSSYITSLSIANPGMMGIGDFSTPGLPIDAKLDIDGDLRIRLVNENNALTRVLVIDENDQNRVHWRNIDDLGNGINCWDTNGDGIDDLSEDTNGDTFFDALDCQGAIGLTGTQGPIGLTGATGATGPAGPIGLTGATGPQGPQGPAGTGGGTVTADNGLHIFGSNNVRLGGTLIETTNIDMSSFNMNFTNAGRYFIGGMGNSKLTVRNDATPWANIAMFNSSVGLNRMRIADNGQTVFDVNTPGSPAISFNATVSGVGWNSNGSFSTRINQDGIAQAGGIVGVGSTVGIIGENNATIAPHHAFSATTRNTLGNNYGYHVLIRDNGEFMQGTNAALIGFLADGEINYGVNLDVRDGRTANYGAYFGVGSYDPAKFIQTMNAINYGVKTSVVGGNTTYGGKFEASGASNKNYGIYASVGGGASGNNPPLPTQQNFAGYFAGEVYISGAYGGPSDIMLKDNINTISDATDIINQLLPKTFEYKRADFPTMNLSQGLQYGLIAQDVETILPELITNVTQPAELDSLGNVITPEINFKGLEYQQLIPLLIAGMKEQQKAIDSMETINTDLETRLATLEDCINKVGICENHGGGNAKNENTFTNNRSVELVNTNSIILDQNLPNPFAENTVINYNIPIEVSEAKLLFYDLNGRIIKELIIEERGESKLTVYGTNLKTGVYTYSLIADGELIATKKMVKK